MKRLCLMIVAALLVLAGSVATAHAQATLYWDVNGTAPGATDPGTGFADGTWDTATANWNPVADGTGTPTTWTAADHAVFSAGNDVTNDPEVSGAFLTVDGTMQAASVLIEEGYVGITSGVVDTPLVTVNADSTLDINSILRFATTPGKVVLNGGTLLQSNPGQAGSFLRVTQTLEVNGIGFIGYNDFNDIPDNQVSIFSGVITGTGGTVDNGGAGTLIKFGPDQIGIGVSNQNGQHSQELFTFAKLEVREGAYRLRHQTLDNTVRETAFGAVPLAVLPDAITLNGGGIGSNTTVTLHENRGITVGPNGGYLDHGATAGLNIPGPLSGSGTLMIGSPTSTATNNVTFTLANPNNVNTFSGDVVAIRGVLQLDSSLTTPNFRSADPAAPGGPVPGASTVSVAAGQTFTFGSGNEDTEFNGNVRGAGTWRKVGTGTTTFTGTVAGNTHSGDTVIEDGTLSITSPYLANAGDVYLLTGAALDLAFTETDTIDQLFLDNMAQEVGLWGAEGNAGATFTTPLITGAGLLQVSTGPSMGVPGDYNNNGTVDAADYVLWRKGAALENEVETIGENTSEDYTAWRARFGNTSGAGSGAALGAASVPEPSAIALALLAAAIGAFAGRRRRG